MDKLYYCVRQMDRLLEEGMENVIKMFLDTKIPKMDLSKFKLTNADSKWLMHKYVI